VRAAAGIILATGQRPAGRGVTGCFRIFSRPGPRGPAAAR